MTSGEADLDTAGFHLPDGRACFPFRFRSPPNLASIKQGDFFPFYGFELSIPLLRPAPPF